MLTKKEVLSSTGLAGLGLVFACLSYFASANLQPAYGQGTIPGFPRSCIIDVLGKDSEGAYGAVPLRVIEGDLYTRDAGGMQSLALKQGTTRIQFGAGIKDFTIKLQNQVQNFHTAQTTFYQSVEPDKCTVGEIKTSGEVTATEGITSPEALISMEPTPDIQLAAELVFTTTYQNQTEQDHLQTPVEVPTSITIGALEKQNNFPAPRQIIEITKLDEATVSFSQLDMATGESVDVSMPGGVVIFPPKDSEVSVATHQIDEITIKPSHAGEIVMKYKTAKGEKLIKLGKRFAGDKAGVSYDGTQLKVTLTDEQGIHQFVGEDDDSDGIISLVEIKPVSSSTPEPHPTLVPSATPSPEDGNDNQLFLPLINV